MFDIGFWELTVIGIVALLVIGPERLPGVARTTGLWLGKIRGFIGSVKADIDQELRTEELKRVLDQQAQSTGLHEILEETEQDLRTLHKPDYLVRSPEQDQALQEELAQLSGEIPAPQTSLPQPAVTQHPASTPEQPSNPEPADHEQNQPKT